MRGALGLALVALSLIVLGPACAAFEGGGESLFSTLAHAAEGQHEGPCCLSADDTASVAAKKPAATDPSAAHVVPVARSSFRIIYASPAPGSSSHAAPPRSLDYHARSARILS